MCNVHNIMHISVYYNTMCTYPLLAIVVVDVTVVGSANGFDSA